MARVPRPSTYANDTSTNWFATPGGCCDKVNDKLEAAHRWLADAEIAGLKDDEKFWFTKQATLKFAEAELWKEQAARLTGYAAEAEMNEEGQEDPMHLS
jgi:hypothetical protein